MNSRIAFPFLTLHDAAVGFLGWRIGDPGKPLHLATDLFEGWDYERDLEIRTGFRFDFKDVAQSLNIPVDELELSAILKAGTGAGSMPRRVDRIARTSATVDKPNVELVAIISSRNLSARLHLETSVLLKRKPAVAGILSPTQAGARLWSDKTDILLEDGGSSRFPIEIVSFSQVFPRKNFIEAPWYVHWTTSDLDGDFGGSVRVYVNSDNKIVGQRVTDGDPQTLQCILADVMSQMISMAVRMEGTEYLDAGFQEGSVGQQIRSWVDMAFPGTSLRSIRAALDSTPGEFEAAILAAARGE